MRAMLEGRLNYTPSASFTQWRDITRTCTASPSKCASLVHLIDYSVDYIVDTQSTHHQVLRARWDIGSLINKVAHVHLSRSNWTGSRRPLTA